MINSKTLRRERRIKAIKAIASTAGSLALVAATMAGGYIVLVSFLVITQK